MGMIIQGGKIEGGTSKTATAVITIKDKETLLADFTSAACIATQAGGTLTITKKIAVKDDEGNTVYIPVGTIA